MNLTIARKIADNPRAYDLLERSAAFTWADRKAGDMRVSAEYRAKAFAIAKAIWDAAA
jgi:hypothetical protein